MEKEYLEKKSEVPEIGAVISFGGYDWRVLDAQNGRALILSNKVLGRRGFHTVKNVVRISISSFLIGMLLSGGGLGLLFHAVSSRIDIDQIVLIFVAGMTLGAVICLVRLTPCKAWEKCDLRKYLNEEFYNKFNPQDRERIAETKIEIGSEFFPDKHVNDKVFLLSLEEALKYFGDSGDFRSGKLWHWNRKSGEYKRSASEFVNLLLMNGHINDQYNNARIAKDAGGTALGWWLRTTPSAHRLSEAYAVVVDCRGAINTNGVKIGNRHSGIRPALWLNL